MKLLSVSLGLLFILAILRGGAQTTQPHVVGSSQISKVSGNGDTLATVKGAVTNGDPACWDVGGNLVDGSCGGSAGLIANIQITVGTTAIGANTCATAATPTMTGLATTSVVSITPASDVSSTTGWTPGTAGQLYFTAWPTANTLNYKVCNPTSASITPGASTTWNVGAK